jgi:hypothetical protein
MAPGDGGRDDTHSSSGGGGSGGGSAGEGSQRHDFVCLEKSLHHGSSGTVTYLKVREAHAFFHSNSWSKSSAAMHCLTLDVFVAFVRPRVVLSSAIYQAPSLTSRRWPIFPTLFCSCLKSFGGRTA